MSECVHSSLRQTCGCGNHVQIAGSRVILKMNEKKQQLKNPKNMELKKQNSKSTNKKTAKPKLKKQKAIKPSNHTEDVNNVVNTSNEPKKPKNSESKRPVNKKSVAQNGLPTIKSVVPKAYPFELTVEISKLPKGYKQINIIEVFSKYGRITCVQRVSDKKAIVAFLTEKEATAAINASRVERIGNEVLTVKKRVKKIKKADESAQRTIFVFRVNHSVTEDDIRKHFETCGEILSVKPKTRGSENYFIVEFANSEAGKAALKLHNSNLEDSIIAVRLQSNQYVPWYPTRTVLLLNKDGLKKVDGSTITSIFSKCGEIENCDVLCDKHKLAIITFKNEADVTKALQLNEKKINGLTVTVESYASQLQRNSVPPKINPHAEKLELAKAKKRKICVKNIPTGTSEKNLKDFFKSCGAVKDVNFLNENGAVVEFNDCDGYCQAFALHTHFYKGRKLHILPFTEQKSEKNNKRSASNQSEPPKKLKKIY